MNRRSRGKKEKSLYLPQEIIEEILSRLPVKSLLRLRCVSKPWLSLISSKSFINKHLENSTRSTSSAYHRVIFKHWPHRCVFPVRPNYMFFYLDDESIDPTKVGRIIGCCNGLLCIQERSERLILWNPATRISAKLPKIDLREKKYGFGWDEQSGAYKLFVKMSIRGETLGKVYSSKTHSWKKVNPGSSCVNDYSGGAAAFASGKIHWLMDDGKHSYIESFDLKSEVFERMELPWFKPFRFRRLRLRERGGCLCAVHEYMSAGESHRREMWVMKQYGVDSSWAKVAELWPSKTISDHYDVYFYTRSLVSPKNL